MFCIPIFRVTTELGQLVQDPCMCVYVYVRVYMCVYVSVHVCVVCENTYTGYGDRHTLNFFVDN